MPSTYHQPHTAAWRATTETSCDIIEHMKAAGYYTDSRGMCYGFAFAAMQYTSCGKLATMLALCTQMSAQQERQDQAGTRMGMSTDHLDKLVLFDAICLFQGNIFQHQLSGPYASIKNLFYNLYRQDTQDYQVANAVLNQGKTSGVYGVSSSYHVFSSADQIKDFLQKDRGKQPLYMVSFDVLTHIVSVIFTDEKWYFFDHGAIVATPGSTCTFTFCTAIFNGLSGSDKPKHVVAYITRYASQAPKENHIQHPYNGHGWLATGYDHIGIINLAMDLADTRTIRNLIAWSIAMPIKPQIITKIFVFSLCRSMTKGVHQDIDTFFAALEKTTLAASILDAIITQTNDIGESCLHNMLDASPQHTTQMFFDRLQRMRQNGLRLSPPANHLIAVSAYNTGNLSPAPPANDLQGRASPPLITDSSSTGAMRPTPIL
jgi:hypothetical protein